MDRIVSVVIKIMLTNCALQKVQMKINFLIIYSNFIPLTITLVTPRANISSSADYEDNNHMACVSKSKG